MVEYTPPPPLEYLNPVQRYMQKGELDRQDWMRLIALVLMYFVLRPYIQKAAKWFFGSKEIEEGEQAQREYNQRRAKVSANAIRGEKQQQQGDIPIEGLEDEPEVVASGSKTSGDNVVVNRKNKPPGSNQKSTTDELLDWDDEPARARADGDKSDVMEWLNKWDK